jgi:hypothetical protein
VDLRNPRFPDTQHCPNLFHGEFFKVVKREDLAFARLEFTHCPRQDLAHFALQTLREGFLIDPRHGRS